MATSQFNYNVILFHQRIQKISDLLQKYDRNINSEIPKQGVDKYRNITFHDCRLNIEWFVVTAVVDENFQSL